MGSIQDLKMAAICGLPPADTPRKRPEPVSYTHLDVYKRQDPIPPPIVAIGAEQYNRLVRLMQHGVTPQLNFDIAVDYQREDQNAFNVIGEIPGLSLIHI